VSQRLPQGWKTAPGSLAESQNHHLCITMSANHVATTSCAFSMWSVCPMPQGEAVGQKPIYIQLLDAPVRTHLSFKTILTKGASTTVHIIGGSVGPQMAMQPPLPHGPGCQARTWHGRPHNSAERAQASSPQSSHAKAAVWTSQP